MTTTITAAFAVVLLLATWNASYHAHLAAKRALRAEEAARMANTMLLALWGRLTGESPPVCVSIETDGETATFTPEAQP